MGETLPPPGRTWDDLQKWGTCRVCGIPCYGWSPLPPGDPRADRCGLPDCERPVELLGPLPEAGRGVALRHYADRGEAAGSPQDKEDASRYG